jgi:hypothetical protein
VDDGDHFMSKRRARQEKTKTSKNENLKKNLKLLIKFFFTFFRSRPQLTPKWSPGSIYIAQPSRKQQKNHSMTSKMDQEKAFFSPLYIGPLAG